MNPSGRVTRENPPERRRVCASNLAVPHGVGHNSVCVCLCRWCVKERAETAPAQGDLFTEALAA